MAGITACTAVNVATYAIVIAIYFGFIAVFVAVDTRKLRIICGVGMAIGTAVPFALVGAGINRERSGIVFAVFRRFPAGVQCMTILTAGWEIERFVVWVRSSFVVGLMTRITLRRNFRIAPRSMTTETVIYGMSSFEREK